MDLMSYRVSELALLARGSVCIEVKPALGHGFYPVTSQHCS